MEMKSLIMDEYIIRSRLRICSPCMQCSEMGGYLGTRQTPVNICVLLNSQPIIIRQPALPCSTFRLTDSCLFTLIGLMGIYIYLCFSHKLCLMLMLFFLPM